jgi:hypothetical protein
MQREIVNIINTFWVENLKGEGNLEGLGMDVRSYNAFCRNEILAYRRVALHYSVSKVCNSGFKL